MGRVTLSVIVSLSFLWCMPEFSQGGSFLQASEVSKQEVEDSLLAELMAALGKGVKSERLLELETALSRMFSSLPKDGSGNLDHGVIRYALHRLLLQQHGWFVKGLEPNKDGSMDTLKEWVPTYLEEFLEKRGAGRGMNLPELAALAATIEDLVHKEAIGRLHALYQTYEISEDSKLTDKQTDQLIDTFVMVYLQGGNVTAEAPDSASKQTSSFKKRYTDWDVLMKWVQEVRNDVTKGAERALGFASVSRIVEEIGIRFGTFNDVECNDLKNTLLGIEDEKKPGRITLAAFYKMGLHSHWQFNEKVDYLKSLGALDDYDPNKPMVIMPNYLASRPQCLESSSFYAVCCRNECEDLMQRLEEQIAEPTALPSTIVELVSENGVDGSFRRVLTETLLTRLNQVAAVNGGRIPLHGRLFAQWLHHAFPRECPFPHEAGTTSPQTANEWMITSGQASTQASEEEMVCHVSGPCAGSENSETGKDSETAELPWLETEELLVEKGSVQEQRLDLGFQGGRAEGGVMAVFNRALRSVALAVLALTLALASRLTTMVNNLETKLSGLKLSTVLLLVFPLVVLTVDYAWGSSTNELLLCGMCWGLAWMLGSQHNSYLISAWAQTKKIAVSRGADESSPARFV